jgi:hypothetical protein
MLVVAGTFSMDTGVPQAAVSAYPVLSPMWTGMAFIGDSLLIIWYCFPDGHFVPDWLRWTAILWVILVVGGDFFQNTLLSYQNWPYPLPDVITDLFAVSIIYSLVYRYRHTSDPVKIQQIKWVVWSVSILAVIKIIPSLIFNSLFLTWDDSMLVIF